MAREQDARRTTCPLLSAALLYTGSLFIFYSWQRKYKERVMNGRKREGASKI